MVFHAGTGRDETGKLLATGGRVLNVTARGATVKDAQTRAMPRSIVSIGRRVSVAAILVARGGARRRIALHRKELGNEMSCRAHKF